MPAEKINVLIVEDESIVALDLSNALEQDGYTVTGIADNADEAIDLFSSNDVDIVLMDINIIGNKDGIDTALELTKKKPVPIIYLTALTDEKTLERAKCTYPAAFLSKPYSITNVRIAIELGINNFASAREQNLNAKVIPMQKNTAGEIKELPDKDTILQLKEHIFVKNNYEFVKIKLSDLLYIEADNNYSHIITTDKKFTLRFSLSHLLEKINYNALVRIHRSYAINSNAIDSFNEMEVLVNKKQLPIGRSYKEEFLKKFDFR